MLLRYISALTVVPPLAAELDLGNFNLTILKYNR